MLLTQTQIGNDFLVAATILMRQVPEQGSPLTDQFEQTASRGMVLLVSLKMLSEFLDTLSEKSDLNFRGTRILIVDAVLRDDACFRFGR